MNGKILDFNAESGEGMLRADDGDRYAFRLAEFKSQGTPTAGMVVDFDIKDNAAVGVYARSGGGGGAGAGVAAAADKAKGVFASFGQQIMHGDPNATVSLTPEQLEEVARNKKSPRRVEKTPPPMKKAPPAKKRRPKKVERPKPIYKCSDCGGDVSARADSCPHCGGPVARCIECKAPLDLSVDQCKSCGREAEASAVSGSTSASCPRCNAKAYAPRQLFWRLFVPIPLIWMVALAGSSNEWNVEEHWAFILVWESFAFVLALFFAVGLLLWVLPKPIFLKPKYVCSRCDHTFYQ